MRLDAGMDGLVPRVDAPGDAPRPRDAGADAGVVPGPGACTNASDGAAATRHDYGPAMDESLADVAAREGRACVLSGATGDELQMCTRDGIVMETGAAVSTSCADCYALHVRCAVENCLAVCVADSDGPSCLSCRCGMNDVGANCVAMFTECSGIPSDECDGI
jgi:hypothetical protein